MKMAGISFFDECQSVIAREYQTWKSFFSKWEAFAKYEEGVAKSELSSESIDNIKSARKKKTKRPFSGIKPRTVSLLLRKKYQRKGKNCTRMTESISKLKAKTKPEKYNNASPQNFMEAITNKHMETTLNAVLMNILKTNQNNVEMFAVLSQTLTREKTKSCNLLLNYQQALTANNFQLNKETHLISNKFPTVVSKKNLNNRFVCMHREENILNVKKNLSGKRKYENSESFQKFQFSGKNMSLAQLSLAFNSSHITQESSQREFCVKSCGLVPLSNSKFQAVELKPLKADFRHESPTSVFRKINIKKTFPEMNITQDGKRFRKLCLHKRTNSVSLSVENSNFITPERNPSEWKCFSENILQRKRRCPSELFFDNLEEDSESDDQTETRAPRIHCKNKLKTPVKPAVEESDSEEYESIFDRIKNSV